MTETTPTGMNRIRSGPNLPIDVRQGQNRNPRLPIDAGETATPAAPSPSREEGRVVGIAAVTGQNIEQLSQQMSGNPGAAAVEATNVAGTPNFEAIIEAAIARGEAPEQAAPQVEDAAGRAATIRTAGDFVLEGVTSAGDPRYNPAMVQLLQNQAIAVEILEDRLEELNRSTGGIVLDFLDRFFLRQFPIGAVEDLTNRTERRGRVVAANAATMSAQEFTEYFNQYADELEQEGFFRSDNYFALQQGMMEATNAGYDPMAELFQAFGLLDVTGMASVSARLGARIAGLSGPASRVSAISGVAAGDAAAANLVEAGARVSAAVVDETLPGALTQSRDPSLVAVRTTRVAEILRTNRYIREMELLGRRGTLEAVADPQLLAAERVAVRNRLLGNHNDPVIDWNPVTGPLGDQFVQVRVGRQGAGDTAGLPFETRAAAEAQMQGYRARGVASEVVPVDPDNEALGFYIRLSDRVDQTRLANAMDLANVSENILARALGSSRAVDDGMLTTIAQMGEAGFNAIIENVDITALNRIDPNSRYAIARVFEELRDGSDALMRRHYTQSEFEVHFQNYHPQGRAATDADFEAYITAVDLSDAAWILQANRLAQRYSRAGYQSLSFNNTSGLGRVADEIPGDEAVFVEGRGIVPRRDLPENANIWQLEEAMDEYRFVYNPTQVRPARYEDVLGYNPGGRRMSSDARYVVTLGNENGVGRAIMSATTETQVTAAVAQLRAIRDAFLQTGARRISDLTDELDDVIARNNMWNPAITNTRELAQFASARAWDLSQPLSRRAMGEKLSDAAVSPLWQGSDMADYVARRMSRSDEALPHYGGGRGESYNPVRAIVEQFNNAAEEFAFRATNYQSKASWLRRANGGKEIPRGTNIDAAFESFDLSRISREGVSSKQADALRAMHAQITRRDNIKSSATQFMDRQLQRVAEWVFDRGWGHRMFPTIDAIQNGLLTFGYYSAFGFANISQFMLQASHAAVVMVISPRAGLEAATLAIPLRFIEHAPVAYRARAMENLSKVMGRSVDELEEIAEYLRYSGRTTVQGDALERGTGSGISLSGWRSDMRRPNAMRNAGQRVGSATNRAMNIGLMPFTAGERLSRHTSVLAAAIEFKRLRPGVSLSSREARKWITRREQDISFNMTTASRGAWQTGIMRIPTQWYSYTMRAMESIVLGRGFTWQERARMAIYFTTVGGLAGFGAHNAADNMSEWLGFEPGGNADVAMRFGFIDGITSWGLSELTGDQIRTAMGTRIAPFSLIVDTYRKITMGEATALEVLAGPSGSMAQGMLSAGWDLATGIMTGDVQIPLRDIERILRTPGGVNNVAVAMGILDHGYYESRTGTRLPMQMDSVQAGLEIIGVTPFERAEFYQRRATAFRQDRSFRTFSREMENHYLRGAELLREGDDEGAAQIFTEVEARLVTSGYSQNQIQTIRRAIRSANENDLLLMYTDMLRNHQNDYGAAVVSTLEGGE